MRISVINLYYLLSWISANCYTSQIQGSLKCQIYNKQSGPYSSPCNSSCLLFIESVGLNPSKQYTSSGYISATLCYEKG